MLEIQALMIPIKPHDVYCLLLLLAFSCAFYISIKKELGIFSHGRPIPIFLGYCGFGIL